MSTPPQTYEPGILVTDLRSVNNKVRLAHNIFTIRNDSGALFAVWAVSASFPKADWRLEAARLPNVALQITTSSGGLAAAFTQPKLNYGECRPISKQVTGIA